MPFHCFPKDWLHLLKKTCTATIHNFLEFLIFLKCDEFYQVWFKGLIYCTQMAIYDLDLVIQNSLVWTNASLLPVLLRLSISNATFPTSYSKTVSLWSMEYASFCYLHRVNINLSFAFLMVILRALKTFISCSYTS